MQNLEKSNVKKIHKQNILFRDISGITSSRGNCTVLVSPSTSSEKQKSRVQKIMVFFFYIFMHVVEKR